MTCREKLAIDCPAFIGPKWTNGYRGCPHHYGYLDKPKECYKLDCRECWNREIPNTEPTPQEPETAPTEQTSHIPSMTDLQWLMRKALGYPGIAVSITFMEDAITFNAYPYPTQEEETNESR